MSRVVVGPGRCYSGRVAQFGTAGGAQSLVLGGWSVAAALLGACTAGTGVCSSCPEPTCGPGFDAGPACSAPPVTVPEDFADVAELRAVASALVCEHALRCDRHGDWVFAESYCHPGFARLQAERSGTLDGPVDLTLARACVAALLDAVSCDAALDAAQICRGVSESVLGRPCEGVCPPGICRDGVCGLPREGEPCTSACEPPWACIGGTCAVPPLPGLPCRSSDECTPWLYCVGGRCAPIDPPPSRSCCGVWGYDSCEVGVCVEGRCDPLTAIGCPCTVDETCPWDVSRCVDGICTARPMLGDPCSPAGAPCFGSACHDGLCVLGRDGDVCGADGDCEWDLVCGFPGPCEPGALFCLTVSCGPGRGPGESCVSDRCRRDLACSARMVCEPI